MNVSSWAKLMLTTNWLMRECTLCSFVPVVLEFSTRGPRNGKFEPSLFR